jgi:hypothetical protein
MNIIKLQNELKGVPDQALIGYVQNPTGQVPTYLALSELQRRKEMRNSYQAAKPETTVAESLVNEAQPQPMQQGIAAMAPQPAPMPQAPVEPMPMPQDPMAPPQGMAQGGLAELDVGNMYDEANYATGGIVAFADGGDTESHMNLNDLPSLNVNTGEQVGGGGMGAGRGYGKEQLLDLIQFSGSPYLAQLYRNQNPTPEGNPFTRDILGPLKRHAEGGEVQHFDEGGTSRLGDFFTSKMNQYDIDRQINELISEKNKYRFDYTGKYKSEERAAKEARNQEIDAKVAALKAQRSGAPVAPSAGPSADVLGSQASADRFAGLQYDPSQALNIKSPTMKPPLAADGTDPYALEKVRGIGDYAKELKDYIGADPMRAKLQERMDKMDATAAKQADQAPWMALAQAGFGMAAGRSPNALLNIAEGAGAGLKDYASAKEKMAALEEKRFGLLADIAKQDRAETIAVAKFGADSKQAIEERNAKAKLQQAHDKVLMKMNTEDNQVRLAAATTKSAMDAKDILAAKEKIRSNNPIYLQWNADMLKKSKNIVNTQAYKDEEEKLVNELVKREAILTGTPTIDTTGWKIR